MEEKFILGPLQQKWVDTLRAHPERQTTGHLGHKELDGSLKLCCLGQAYLIICESKNQKPKQVAVSEIGYNNEFEDNNSTGTLSSYNEIGLRNTIGIIDNISLAKMNDKGSTWPEIADFIEEHATELFTKSV